MKISTTLWLNLSWFLNIFVDTPTKYVEHICLCVCLSHTRRHKLCSFFCSSSIFYVILCLAVMLKTFVKRGTLNLTWHRVPLRHMLNAFVKIIMTCRTTLNMLIKYLKKILLRRKALSLISSPPVVISAHKQGLLSTKTGLSLTGQTSRMRNTSTFQCALTQNISPSGNLLHYGVPCTSSREHIHALEVQ